ncbi:phospholipase A1-like [Cochliomyia hominivorax]
MKLYIFIAYWLLFKAYSHAGDVKNTSNTKFYLYTKNNPDVPQELFNNNENSIKMSNFNNSLPTKILIHGWLGSYKNTLNVPLRDSYLSQSAYNIISVDWQKEASSLLYYPAVQHIPAVGHDIAQFIEFLNEKFNITFDSIVLIGHSLGAHVAGFCGKSVKRGKLKYIVGLDPASTLQRYDKPAERLNNFDADYVLTLQTDARSLDNAKGRGFLEPIGSTSFYANWGRRQPGCNRYLCSHIRCIHVYAEAIRGFTFDPINKCESLKNIIQRNGCNEVANGMQLGDPSQMLPKEGIYNFFTNSKEPYGHLK